MDHKFIFLTMLALWISPLRSLPAKPSFTEEAHFSQLEAVFGSFGEAAGRSDVGGLELFRRVLARTVLELVESQGWVPARLLSRALSVNIDWSSLNTSQVSVKGQVTACHASPPCLDLACGKCFDPLTSIHGDCGDLSYFKCENLLPEVCLPWTCAKTAPATSRPLLRNFLPRSSGCSETGSLSLLTDQDLQDSVELIGLGLTLNALTACSEEPACWDSDCGLCYDPLEQQHSPCPPSLTVHSCSHLPLACQPYLCWPKHSDLTNQTSTVLIRDFRHNLNSC